MSTAAVPDKRRRYVIAGAMVVLAIAVGAVFGVILARAISGYDITPLDGDETSVTVGDRKLAIWVSPEGADVSCSAVEDGTSRESFSASSSNTSMTIADRNHSWERLGLLDGEPGSTHTLTCTTADEVQIGYADNPRVLRYVVLGLVLGGAAALLMLSAFVLALVTALRKPPRPAV